MMLRPLVIGFDDDPKKDDVVFFAVAPIDALSGRIVQQNVTANVTVAGETAESEELKLPDKPIRNLSGLLVFIIKPLNHPKYRIHIKARTAGYFDPEPVDFTPPERNGKNALDLKELLRIDFMLFPRPDFVFDEEVTLISGVVVRENNAVEGTRISVIVPVDEGIENPRPPQTFETRSDERGAFSLALSLPAFSVNRENGNNDEQSEQSVPVKFRIETKNGDGEWQLYLVVEELKVIERQRNVFKLPLDPDNPDKPIILTS